ncbi:MAG: nucleotidyl transferase AbiEii/AbiGii toxin family protein [Elusimicrobia bacterium]|nr:nucleotidyl transferase AbiEii/AbiGii toxin family protein [Elusimicrobiota bacterium]
MIPQAYITHWRNTAPWPQDAQVEQDLILSRALVEIYRQSALSGDLILRGGTALHKLYLAPARRYSEDIDLVQRTGGPIGPILDAIRQRLDAFLGEPRRENNPDNVTLRYRVESEIPPVIPIRLKIEINTREHFFVFNAVTRDFSVQSPWFKGDAKVAVYALEELLATKLRALFQRRKGRDLYDLWIGLERPDIDPARIVKAFLKYLEAEGTKISRRAFEKNLEEKISNRSFADDLRPLLIPAAVYDIKEAAEKIKERLLSRLL